jgi:hypothetical protein
MLPIPFLDKLILQRVYIDGACNARINITFIFSLFAKSFV